MFNKPFVAGARTKTRNRMAIVRTPVSISEGCK